MENENKLIAEFMGADFNTAKDFGYFKPPINKGWYISELNYDTDWRWLMPVWLKIAKWGWDNHENYWTQNIGRDFIVINNFLDIKISIPVMYGEIKIEQVYDATVQFITYFNNLKP